MIKFPSIELFRQVHRGIIRTGQFTHVDAETKMPCYDSSAPLPVLEFRGSVKLHGTNAAIVQTFSPTSVKTIHFQSRQRILSEENDLVGFCAYMSGNMNAIVPIFEAIHRSLTSSGKGSEEGNDRKVEAIAVFGEWCGMGIQEGVALSKLQKMFVIFSVKIVYRGGDAPSEWLDMSKLVEVKDEKARIFNIMQFPTFRIVIDFSKQERIADAMKEMDELTLSVEEECPVGKYFGVSGTGEGIVWQAIQSPSLPVFNGGQYTNTSRFWFKTKGVKHASYRKPETRKKPSASPQATGKMDAFVELVLTAGRLQQGLQVLEREMLLPIEIKSVGAFIKWVNEDVMKEEYDRIQQAGIDKKTLLGPMSAAAGQWYINELKDVTITEKEMKTLTLET